MTQALQGEKFEDFLSEKDRKFLMGLRMLFPEDIAWMLFEINAKELDKKRPDYLQNEVPF